MRNTDLSVRTNGAVLPAASGTSGPPPFLLLAESGASAWRLVELVSASRAPFEAEVGWTSSGSPIPPEVRLTVASAARVCIFARAVGVGAKNLANRPNEVRVAVADGFAVTRNVLERTGAGTGADQPLDVPPFAQRVGLDVADISVAASSMLRLEDGQGVERAARPVDSQPDGGLPVGGTARVIVLVPAGVQWRVVYELGL
jgi:hypothetical protein